MDLGTIANVATAAAVITGLAFGLAEIGHARREREERIAFEVLHAMLTPEWMRSVFVIEALPDGLSIADLNANPRALEAAHFVAVTLETLGYAVFRRMVSLRMVDELLGGITRVGWRKIGPFIRDERALSGSQKSMEWFQWLAERLEEHHPARTSLAVGAHDAYRKWRP
jgi:hypothetical protein